MKIELEKVSNGWVIKAAENVWSGGTAFYVGKWITLESVHIARNVPDCLAELSKIMDDK